MRKGFHLIVTVVLVSGCDDGGVVLVDAGRDAVELDARGLDAPIVSDALDVPPDPDAAESDAGEDAHVEPFDVGEDSWVPHPVECVLYPQAGCDPGLGCYPAGHEGSQCVRPTAASAAPGDPCGFTNDCVPGSFCDWLGARGERTCLAICALGGSRCATCVDAPEYRLADGFGVCR